MQRLFLIIAVVILAMSNLTGCGKTDTYSDAEAAFESGRYEAAIELYTEAAKESDNPAIYVNRGTCHSCLGDLDAALQDYATAIEKSNAISKDPNDPRLAYVYFNRGTAYEKASKWELAIADYEKTISLNNEYPDVKNNLAWLLATCSNAELRNPQRAVQLATSKCEQTGWQNPYMLDTLAAAYASAGDFPKAAETQEKAIGLPKDPSVASSFQERLKLYRQNKSFVDKSSD